MKDESHPRQLTTRSSFVLHAIVFTISHIIMIMVASIFPIFISAIVWMTPIWCTLLLIHCMGCLMLNEKILNAVINA